MLGWLGPRLRDGDGSWKACVCLMVPGWWPQRTSISMPYTSKSIPRYWCWTVYVHVSFVSDGRLHIEDVSLILSLVCLEWEFLYKYLYLIFSPFNRHHHPPWLPLEHRYIHPTLVNSAFPMKLISLAHDRGQAPFERKSEEPYIHALCCFITWYTFCGSITC